jgi:hypothetical protein
MSEQQADDESVEVPQDTGAEAPDPSKSDDSSGSSDNGSSDSGSSDADSGDPGGVSDAELPEDLQATEDNPLARHPRQTGDEDDKIGADSETGDAENPSASMTYGEDDDSDESSNTSDEGDGDTEDSDS